MLEETTINRKELFAELFNRLYNVPLMCHSISKSTGFYDGKLNELSHDRILSRFFLINDEIHEAGNKIRSIVPKENQSDEEALISSIEDEWLLVDQLIETFEILSINYKSLSPEKRIEFIFQNEAFNEQLKALKDGFIWEMMDTIIRIMDVLGWTVEKTDFKENPQILITELIRIINFRNLNRGLRHGKAV